VTPLDLLNFSPSLLLLLLSIFHHKASAYPESVTGSRNTCVS
jgi:hypothetical protein